MNYAQLFSFEEIWKTSLLMIAQISLRLGRCTNDISFSPVFHRTHANSEISRGSGASHKTGIIPTFGKTDSLGISNDRHRPDPEQRLSDSRKREKFPETRSPINLNGAGAERETRDCDVDILMDYNQLGKKSMALGGVPKGGGPSPLWAPLAR
ncbi:hypothetical protein TNCV_3507851 [Trichonephila clavipes]|uniref:Uncharacterized protein n=1 Tax=Trichonephila clavipes TaxID=2585209 RepID=A0A8X6S1S7_TRICX|nr:hypothetical protein TNCV_3507851 [Trichonephila clavipes]